MSASELDTFKILFGWCCRETASFEVPAGDVCKSVGSFRLHGNLDDNSSVEVLADTF